jgi:hypothetical protein
VSTISAALAAHRNWATTNDTPSGEWRLICADCGVHLGYRQPLLAAYPDDAEPTDVFDQVHAKHQADVIQPLVEEHAQQRVLHYAERERPIVRLDVNEGKPEYGVAYTMRNTDIEKVMTTAEGTEEVAGRIVENMAKGGHAARTVTRFVTGWFG